MRWHKLGLICGSNKPFLWAISHAMVPTPYLINDQVLRVFVTSLDQQGRGRPGFIDVSVDDPREVLGVSSSPLLDLGTPGSFDDNGVMAVSVVSPSPGIVYMYYVGFELCKKIPYRIFTGLAISNDNGASFIRYSKAPILDRTNNELHFRCGPFVTYGREKFRLWYVAGSEWTSLDGKAMPVYDIRYAESRDGMNWPDQGEVQIAITEPDEHGFGRPCVIPKQDGGYRLFYSVRRRSFGAYRLGYAESSDGKVWKRMDGKLNLDVTPGAFDSNAIMYAAPIELNGKLYVFYNGNDFGRDGVAVARLEAE